MPKVHDQLPDPQFRQLLLPSQTYRSGDRHLSQSAVVVARSSQLTPRHPFPVSTPVEQRTVRSWGVADILEQLCGEGGQRVLE